MSVSAAHADAFVVEVVRHGTVWVIEDDAGIPAPAGTDGHRAMPFWSSRARADRVIRTVPGYALFRPRELRLDEFVTRWLPGLDGDGLLVGVNWTGPRATGHDLEPTALAARIASRRSGSGEA